MAWEFICKTRFLLMYNLYTVKPPLSMHSSMSSQLPTVMCPPHLPPLNLTSLSFLAPGNHWPVSCCYSVCWQLIQNFLKILYRSKKKFWKVKFSPPMFHLFFWFRLFQKAENFVYPAQVQEISRQGDLKPGLPAEMESERGTRNKI